MYQYDYRTESGDLFATVAPTLNNTEKNVILGLVHDNKPIVVYND